MTKTLPLIILFLGSIASTTSNAQSWCPPGAEWIYKPFFTTEQGSSRYYYVGDTVLGGRTGQRIAWDFAQLVQGGPDIIQMHSDTRMITSDADGIVNIWVADSSAWDTLFWFSAMPGDRWHSWNDQFFPVTSDEWLVVQDTSTLVVDGIPLRQLSMVQVCAGIDTTYVGTITERIGYYPYESFPVCAIVDGLWELVCYNDSIIHYSTGQTCDILTGMDEPSTRSAALFPNPGDDQVSIQLPMGPTRSELLLWDATGRLVLQQSISSDHAQLDTRQLLSGLYAYRVRSASGEVLGQGPWVKW